MKLDVDEHLVGDAREGQQTVELQPLGLAGKLTWLPLHSPKVKNKADNLSSRPTRWIMTLRQ